MNLSAPHYPLLDDDERLSPKDDILEEICAEVASYGEDFARSNEDGWFYSDEDPGLDGICDPGG